MASRQEDSAALPPRLMDWVFWCISGERYTDRSAFEDAVTAYNAERDGTAWHPTEVVLRVPQVFVTADVHWHFFLRGHSTLEPPMVELIADDGREFTAGELLFKIHNALLEEVHEMDHKFFEGLNLVDQVQGVPPVYEVVLGS